MSTAIDTTDDPPVPSSRRDETRKRPKVVTADGARKAKAPEKKTDAKRAPDEDGPAKAKAKAEPQARKAPPAKAAPRPVADGKVIAKLRRQRMRNLAVRFGLFVVLPTLVAIVYFGGVATDQFESHASFTVHSVESPASGVEGLLGGLVGSGSSRDTLVARDHILSRDMLERLDREHAFSAHWQDPQTDIVARLPSDASREEAYEHYLDRVGVEYDSNSGVLTLRVRALDPESAQRFAQAMLDYSEERVNELTRRERIDRTRYAEAQVRKSEERLSAARKAVLNQQRKNARLDPRQEAGASMTVRTSLESELAQAKAKLMELQGFMKGDAPKVKRARKRVAALSAQVAAEKKKLVDPKGDGGLAASLADFDEAMVEKEFAEAAYTTALAGLEAARADAARQHRYVAVIAPPSRPDESTYPERLLGVFTVFLMSFLLMGIGSLIIASVREHARV